VTPVYGSMPSFNNIEIDLDTMKPVNYRVTSLDITSAYGMIDFPNLDEVNYNTMHYKDYGFKDLTADGIANGLVGLRESGLDRTLEYLTDKIGFVHTDEEQFAEGLNTVEGWSLISPTHTSAAIFFCQTLHARDIGTEFACVQE